ncbi:MULTISPECIES: sulfite reductase flavoprotein subunit alpha [unclassified Mycolicibacterium]|uniref:diflavin oxidoreductase n=1 Tax=unclassified Mycolicibacterium TaxID=2636767 RepID=UPI0012DC20DA|nr:MULTISPECIES: sulfite reductase flavoprotein subunit alpha [unclassified Mycolicibacterium]MUL80549.1 sulfite reductase flavoprotein subunit alpha [Mycolicibacterium sp. CBMA 329]MUL86316.1 sulfite reductase flavoprotein subunit alpha [Mycolicibacterium sp. CBMA 331]MUM01023.1 sulfite reductase flavoprotein subunit alpha [Mycolicibacterium sp. CBMA 334]MUM36612.1 sulfite reductase flavoprotein subunit alpha [Mycolicibacterium sp. CBMA 247]MUM42380.1 sulfite reductase flavoprotein subunit al
MVVAYGTDMGNAEDAAMSFAEATTAAGIPAEAVELNQVEIDSLSTTTHFIAVTSTFGDGEFPDTATLFWEAISASTERLEHMSFAVLALGDTSYELFCNAGILLDARLEELGATRLADRVDVDGYYEEPAAAWTTDLVKQLIAAQAGPTAQAVTVIESTPADPPHRSQERNQPVAAPLLVNRLLTSTDSDKEVRHYELDLTGSGIAYQAGDSLAVHPLNDPDLVAAILTELKVGPEHRLPDADESLGVLLAERLEIRTPSRALQELAGPAAYGEDVLDLIRRADLTVEEIVDTLRPLQFRDYSIASSPLVHPDHVHLTVATVRYPAGERRHGGVASTYLAERTQTVRVHLRPNTHFRLPAGDVPIIMIGPGTGIAPFRAFLQDRQAAAAPGRSWLFFGDRRRATDFLYGEELTGFAESGTLTRLDVAFSRDQDAKVYVQQRMRENSAELFAWLQDGAHLYVCGDADRMAKDVDAALHEIVATSGGMDADAAHAYVNDLIKTHRYLRDVY